MKITKILSISFLFVSSVFTQFEYSLEDMNSTSPSFGNNVWSPYYSEYITLHYISTQGWAGWTATFGQLSNFQQELREEGYENVVIIAVGQSNISNFNSNFTANSNCPLVMDPYPSLPIRSQLDGYHKDLIMLGFDGGELTRFNLGAGLNNGTKNTIRGILESAYVVAIPGDINEDEIVNILDVIQTVNMVLGAIPVNELADLNEDGLVNVVDIILIVNTILTS